MVIGQLILHMSLAVSLILLFGIKTLRQHFACKVQNIPDIKTPLNIPHPGNADAHS